MAQFIQVNGILTQALKKVMACKYGLMGLSMKGIGMKIKQTGRVGLYLQMEMYMKGSG